MPIVNDIEGFFQRFTEQFDSQTSTGSMNMGFSVKGSRCTAKFILSSALGSDFVITEDEDGEVVVDTEIVSTLLSDLKALPIITCGGVEISEPSSTSADGLYLGIKRYLPQRHPLLSNLVMTAVNSARGRGRIISNAPDSQNDPIFGKMRNYPLWTAYEVDVEYGPRNYNYFPDIKIGLFKSTYYNYLGNPVEYYYANEWIRYTKVIETPGTDVITFKRGKMFAATSDDNPPGTSNLTTAYSYAGTPIQTLPDSTVKLTWYQVPYKYIISPYSFIANCPKGVINQNAFYTRGATGDTVYPPGSLLFTDYSFEDYLPQSLLGVDESNIEESRLCDITFIFKRTTRDRYAVRLPTPAQVGAAPTTGNANWIIGGWNLQPCLIAPNEYYYFHTADQSPGGDINTKLADKTKWFPTFNSFPFELFFTNPEGYQPEYADMLEVQP